MVTATVRTSDPVIESIVLELSEGEARHLLAYIDRYDGSDGPVTRALRWALEEGEA